MPEREFEITIGPNGQVEVHAAGFKGKNCLEALKFFEQIVGEVRDRQLTSQFYEPEENVQFRIDQRV